MGASSIGLDANQLTHNELCARGVPGAAQTACFPMKLTPDITSIGYPQDFGGLTKSERLGAGFSEPIAAMEPLLPQSAECDDPLQIAETGRRFPVPGSRFLVPGSRFSVLGSRFPVPGSRFSVLGSRLPVPGNCQLPLFFRTTRSITSCANFAERAAVARPKGHSLLPTGA
jgi:hypothetical protein